MYEHSLLRPVNNLNGNLEPSMKSCLSYNGANHHGICEMKSSIRVFHSLYKVGRNGIILFKGFNNSKSFEYNNAISANFVQTVKNLILLSLLCIIFSRLFVMVCLQIYFELFSKPCSDGSGRDGGKGTGTIFYRFF